MPRVLLIEDDESLRRLISLHLLKLGHEVIESANGRDITRILKEHAPDLVITDIVMPEKDGIEVILELRKAQPNLPVIAISGGSYFSGAEYLAIASHLGVRQTLTKPFEPQALGQAIREVMGHTPSVTD